MATIKQKLCTALEARGEVKLAEIDGCTVHSLRFHATRKDGQLVPITKVLYPIFWYVSRSGALRVGYSVKISQPIGAPVVRALLEEGQITLDRAG